ncbi:MAG: hypothetical protein WCK91_00695 [bacterium]
MLHGEKFIVLLLGLFFLSFFILPTHRIQALDAGIVDSDVNVDLFPENAQPYSDMTITLSSYAADLNKALIVWKNGKNTLQSGYGKTSYSFKTLAPDQAITFKVTITIADANASLTKTITINPQELDILWESVDGYTPPFYKGKSFVSSEGTIKAVAIPNSSTLGSSKGRVTYTWKADNNTNLAVSGYGKDAYVFKNSNLNTSENISVSASSIDGNYDAQNNVRVPIVDPKIVFYKRSPTEGVLYNNALVDEASITEDEATIVAAPYFLVTKGQDLNLTYSWQTNGQDVKTPDIKNELTVHPTSRGGYATIDLVIENTVMLFQKVQAQLKLDL